MRIALAGNPNSGKTTLYNALTGQTEQVGNWSGVTVEKKSAPLKAGFIKKADIQLIDLPGAYSISPYTQDEAITRDVITGEALDAVINIVDGANISRSLYFTTQLLELGIPVIIALNKADIIEKRKDLVAVKALETALGCQVVPITATSGEGLAQLMDQAVLAAESRSVSKALQFDGKGAPNEDSARQRLVNRISEECIITERVADAVTLSDRIDRVLADKWLGLPIFFLIMWGVYSVSIGGLGGYLSGYFNDVLFGEMIPQAATSLLESMAVAPLMQALIIDGILAGVGAVIGFLPLIMVLFFLLGLLEDSGYMARVAVVMDRYFKKIGLSGKSIIPMIVGSGCGIPGVMATRTIEDVNERRMTIILTPFVPCGAKLPVIALLSAVFFPGAGWVGASMYILAIGVIVVGGLLLKRMFVWDSYTPFIMELPEYKLPSLKHAFSQMMRQAKGFIYKASTIILLMNTLIWFLQAYNFALQPVSDQSTSMLAAVGGVLAPFLIPLGFVGWQLAAAAISGFIAKENVVATIAILLAAASEEALMMPNGPLSQLLNPVTGYAFLVFNLFTPPCFAAVGAMNSEMGSRSWLLKGVAFQFGVGYVLAMAITQIGTLVVYGHTATGFIPAVVIAGAFAAFLTFRVKRADRIRLEAEALTSEGGAY